MLDYLKRFLIAGIVALCVSLLFFGGKPQAESLDETIDWIWPTDGIISDTYGTRYGHHKGIDIAGDLNSPIFAVDDGQVKKSYYSDTYGHVIFIKHSNNNLETVYAHLNKRNVEVGQNILKGEIIGRMGNTGESNGVHLHFEVHENEWTFDKENALNPSIVLGKMAVGNIVQALSDEQALSVVKNIKTGESEQVNDNIMNKLETKQHIVRSGETLWSISQKYSTTIETIQQANSLSTTLIYENQTLNIPK
ncbi:peptidoglycan DD-metalloendopeptidase family protein [Pseudoneobacillus sp. C159]